MIWPGGARCSSHPLFYVVFLYLSLIFTLFFSRPGGVLYFLVTSVSSSSLWCNEHSFLLNSILLELRILHAAPVVMRPRTPFNPFCTVQLRTLRCTLFGDQFLSATCDPGPGESPDFWGSKVFRRVPIPWKRSSNSNNLDGTE